MRLIVTFSAVSRGGQVIGKQTPEEVRDVILGMVTENPTWGAPRIHGEMRMLGF